MAGVITVPSGKFAFQNAPLFKDAGDILEYSPLAQFF